MCSSCCRFVFVLYKRDFKLSLSDKIEVFNFTSRNLDGFLNSDNHYFEQMISPIDLDIVKLTFLDGDVLAVLLFTSPFLCLS